MRRSRRQNELAGYKHAANKPIAGDDLIRLLADQQDTIILSFSRGKDAAAAWLKLRPHFKRIIPVFLYLIPDLEFEEESLAYYEEYFDQHIMRLPSPSLHRLLESNVFQTPDRWSTIQDFEISPKIDHDMIFQAVCDDQDLPENTFVATGVRAADSPNRRSAIYKHGPITLSRTPPLAHVVWDMKKDPLIGLLQQHELKLPREYEWFGRSFDGIDLRFLYQIKQHAPRDYQRILEWFPLADLELFRYECHLKNTGVEYGKAG